MKFIAHLLMFLVMVLIKHKSVASDEYGFNANEDKIAIELNVNININGSKTKDIVPGKSFLTRSYIEMY